MYAFCLYLRIFQKENIMRTINIDYPYPELNYQMASAIAKDVGCESEMIDPTIISWHHSNDDNISPNFDGGNHNNWWQKFGEGNGAQLTVHVGNQYQFSLMDANQFERLSNFPLKNMKDSNGDEYVCLTPLLKTNIPYQDSCTKLDEWTGNQL